MQRKPRPAAAGPSRTDRGVYIRSLLAGNSGAKSAHSFAFLQKADYESAQAALTRHKSASELGGKQAKGMKEAAKASHEKFLCAEHRAVYRKELELLKTACRDANASSTTTHMQIVRNTDDASIMEYCQWWHAHAQAPSLAEDVLHPHASPQAQRSSTAHGCESTENTRDMVILATTHVLGVHESLQRQCSLVSQLGEDGARLMLRTDSTALKKSVESLKALTDDVGSALQTAEDELNQALAKFPEPAAASSVNTTLQCCGEQDPLYFSRTSAGERLCSEVSSWDWPSEELRCTALQECHHLNSQLSSNIDSLMEKYASILRPDTRHWPCPDSDYFNRVIAQYEAVAKNRYTLLVDRCRRQFPRYSKKEIDDQYQWCLSHRYFHYRLDSMARDSAAQRERLLTYLQATLRENASAIAEVQAVEQLHSAQTELCKRLNEQLATMRSLRAEEAKLQEAIHAFEQEKQLENARRQEEDAKKKRDATKRKVEVFQKQKEDKQARVHAENVKKLAELQAVLAEQLKHDRERVAFRKDQLEQRVELQQREKHRLRQLSEERERRLDELRATVAVNVADDPTRVLQDTEASAKHRHDAVLDGSALPMQQPLFDVKSFTSEKVMADPRMRIYEMLQDQGLHQSEYASRVMASLPPTRPQRPDQKTTHRFTEQ
eukprot:scpid45531/ scgid20735/ Coiled-coil domain-containing protein 148